MKFAKYLKLYMMISTKYIQSKMSYRADFIISSLGILITNIIDLAVVWVLLQTIKEFKGWTYYEMVFLYSFMLLAVLPAQLFFDNFWNLKTYIQEGTFIKYYFRPLNIMFSFTADVLDIKGGAQGILGIILIVWSSIKLHYEWNFFSVLLLIVLLLFSSLIMSSLLVISASTSFWIVNSDSVMTLASKFKEFARYPISIYNKFFTILLTYIIPVGFISFYPSDLLIHADTYSRTIYLLPVISLLFFALSVFVFTRGTKVYSGTGS